MEDIKSPDDSFVLPCYIQPLAHAFVEEPPESSSGIQSKSRRVGFGVHRFLDLDAKVGFSSGSSPSSSDSSDYS